MKASYEIIKTLLKTEKSTKQESMSKYLFLVDKRANKIQIRKAVKDIYKVDAISVNTFISGGKLRRVRHQLGKTPDFKKAIVTLKTGQKIEVA